MKLFVMVSKYSFYADEQELESLLQALRLVHSSERYPRSLRMSARKWLLKLTNSYYASDKFKQVTIVFNK